MRHLLLSLVTLAPLTSVHAEGPALRSAAALSTRLEGPKLTAELTPGHAFNLKAPNQVTGLGKALKPTTSADRRLDFTLPEAPKAGALAMLYVCDEAKTYCDIHKVELAKVAGPKVAAAAPSAAKSRVDKFGFHHGSYEEMLTKARQEKKKVFLDFGARWCPGCIRLKTEVYPTPAFQKTAESFVKVHVDVDLVENFDLAKAYGVASIPTLVVLNPQGEEVNRLPDFESWSQLEAFLKDVTEFPESLTELKAAKDPGGEKLRRLALRLHKSGRFAEALPYLEKLNPRPPETLETRIRVAAERHETEKSDASRAALADALKKSLAEEGESLRSLDWRVQMIDLTAKDSKERQELIAGTEKVVTKLLNSDAALKQAAVNSSVGEFKGLEKFLVAFVWADFLASAEAPEARVKNAWAQAAAIGRASSLTESHAGPGLRYLIVLMAAEKWEDADKWVLRLIERQPENKDLLRRRLRVLNEMKRFEEATKVGEEALRHAEGRMEFLTTELLAKAYIGAKKPKEAKELLGRQLARPELRIAKLEEQRKKLESLADSVK